MSEINALTSTIAAYDASAVAHHATFSNVVQPHLADLLERMSGWGVVLDLGCGTGRDLAGISASGHTPVGVDLSAGMLQAARAGSSASLVRADVRALPFSNASVQGIWSSAGLVHLEHAAVAEALVEAARVSCMGAPLGMLVRAQGDLEPTGWEESSFGRRWYSRWSVQRLEETLVTSGWTVSRIGLEADTIRPSLTWVWADAFKA